MSGPSRREEEKVYSRFSGVEIKPEYIDDLGVRIGARVEEDNEDRIAGPAVHDWLTGVGGEKYTRKSRYYSRMHYVGALRRFGSEEHDVNDSEHNQEKMTESDPLPPPPMASQSSSL